MDHKLQIVILLTIGFGLASLFGALAQKIKLPSILGFLLAGYAIGPYSPGFVADPQIAEQLAEIGVVLMLFGVGLHFKLKDLLSVKKIAIPGAIGQTLIASVAGILFVVSMGWPLENGIIMGLAISVASTVVLVRVLTDFKLLDSVQGHIAVGWLIVEDLLTIMMLVLLPVFALITTQGTFSFTALFTSVAFFLVKFSLLAFILLGVGYKVVGKILASIARLKSQELFTLTVLALTFIIATGAAVVFDTSIALGAFLAGMVIGQTEVRHQAFANSLPLKDIFAVIFFLSIGMLFDPTIVMNYFGLFIGILAIIMVIKPLAAWGIVRLLSYPNTVAITVALALAQIGEFSFILAEQAMHLKILPDAGYDILVGCAFISISLNPLLFRLYFLWSKKGAKIKALSTDHLAAAPSKISHFFEGKMVHQLEAIVVGFGPIGQEVTKLLESKKYKVVIVEDNIDTLTHIAKDKHKIIYGDASVPNILQVTEVTKTELLIITVPDIATTVSIIKSARYLNPKIRIIARILYISEKEQIKALQAEYVCTEEETAKEFVRLLSK
ncbi:MAG: cation:proton antiporter [Chlamydiales bacterium]|nr:cation:proton antiporter [Chlamydiales bacterium]